MARFHASNLPVTQGHHTGVFQSVTVTEGTATWHAGAEPTLYEKDTPAVDIDLRGPDGANVLIELLIPQAQHLAAELLKQVVAAPTPQLVDLAAELLQRAGWWESDDGALNPPPRAYGFTVQVTDVTAESAQHALLRRLRDAGDRSRFAVEVNGEVVWDGAQ